MGVPVIDADQVYHSLLSPPSDCLTSLRHAFGDGIFKEDGSLDRVALSEKVFSQEDQLRLLNATVLHFVLERIRGEILRLSREGKNAVAVDGPTLIESGFHKECDLVLSILSPLPLRLKRIMERDGISEERARARILAQPTEDFYRSHSHWILYNDGDWNAVRQGLKEVLRQLNEGTKEKPKP